MEDLNNQIDSEIEEHIDENLLKKEELRSQISEADDDDIPDFETESHIELFVGNEIRCFEKVGSKEFNKGFDIKKEPTENRKFRGTQNSVDNLFEGVANSQPKFKQVSTKMKKNQNQTEDITETIKFLKDVIFEDVTEIKVEQNQEIKVEQNQEIKVEQNQEIKVEQNQEIKVEQNQENQVEQNQKNKVEQNQEISELKSSTSNDQEPVPGCFTWEIKYWISRFLH